MLYFHCRFEELISHFITRISGQSKDAATQGTNSLISSDGEKLSRPAPLRTIARRSYTVGLGHEAAFFIFVAQVIVAAIPLHGQRPKSLFYPTREPNGLLLGDEQVARNFNQERLITRLTELFGALALILACIGLYGITAYGVARRTNEIGIRMALGADRGNVLSLVLRAALAQVGLGLAIGIPTALAGGHLLAHQLYGVGSYDPTIFGAAALVLTACAIFAASVPARRATRVDPMIALRYE